MAIAKRFDMAHSMVCRLWERVAHMCATGIFQEAAYLSDRVCSRGCHERSAKGETYPVKTGNVDGNVKTHCASLDCCINHSCSL